MTRRCSNCNNISHNSRTCPIKSGAAGGIGGVSGGGAGGVSGGGVRLFGVKLTDGPIMKKSASMGNLYSLHNHSPSSIVASPNPSSLSSDVLRESIHLSDGYLSDDPANAACSANHMIERKKGIPWTEKEHRFFLIGLKTLGKGDWRGISRNFVTSRTPTQVASHAQKYFIRQSNAAQRKRRTSVFDIVADTANDASNPLPEEQFMFPPRAMESEKEQLGAPSSTRAIKTDFAYSLSSLDLSLKSDYEPMETTPSEPVEETKYQIPLVFPTYFPAYIPVPYPFWPSNAIPGAEDRGSAEPSHHEIIKPIPVIPIEPVNVDELVGMSKLSLADQAGSRGHKLTAAVPSKQSAFHASTPVKGLKIT